MNRDKAKEAMKVLERAMNDPDTVRVTIIFNRLVDGGWDVIVKVKKDDLLTEEDPDKVG